MGLSYANGSANTVRPTGMDYPSGRTLTYDYGSSGGISDHASRIASLIGDNGTTHLADYSFLGLGAIMVVDFTEPDVEYTLVDLSGSNDPDTGDIYSGLDRFGRVKDCRWYDYGSSADVARLKYGYDRASNRLWRADTVAQAASQDFDELYSYDGLHRLQTMERGLLNGGHTAIGSQTYGQCWNLDATGNWTGMNEADAGSTWTLQQSRTANPVNEITGITNTVGSAWAQPAYDPAGNMTTIPQPADPTQSYTATYDAWNRLVKLVDGSDTVQENAYDARTFRTVRKDYTGGTLSETRHFYYDPAWRCVEERVGTSTSPNRQYVWGLRYIDDLVLRDRDTGGGTLDERLYGLQDANWNMVALVDTTGAVQERYAYAPYGDVAFLSAAWAVLSDSTVDNGYTFTGRELDATTALFYFRMRWLHAAAGTFTGRDPIAYLSGPNLATFVESRPTVAVDPLGLFPPWELLADPDGGNAVRVPIYTPYPPNTPSLGLPILGSVITPRPTRGTLLRIRDANGSQFGELHLLDINCIGHAIGLNASLQCGPGVSVNQIMSSRGYNCKPSATPIKCVSECGKAACVFVYLYRPKGNPIKPIPQSKDPFEVGIGDYGLDIHGLQGIGISTEGGSYFSYVPEDMPKTPIPNSDKLAYTPNIFVPTDKTPHPISDPSRIVGSWCCCSESRPPFRPS